MIIGHETKNDLINQSIVAAAVIFNVAKPDQERSLKTNGREIFILQCWVSKGVFEIF